MRILECDEGTDAVGEQDEDIEAITYLRCANGTCLRADPLVQRTFGYQRGFFTSVAGFANDIDYQAGGMLHRIAHANGVLETVSINPADGLRRPTNIVTSAGWSTGVFDYDGGGNIKKMGAQDFTYDRLSRLTLGEAATGGLEAITYDSFGNIQSMNTGGVFQSTPTSATNNRLTLAGTTYDPAGNLTRLTLGGETFEYEYDGLSMMRSLISTTDQPKIYGLLSISTLGIGGNLALPTTYKEMSLYEYDALSMMRS